MSFDRHVLQYGLSGELTLNTAIGTTPEIRFENMSGGMIFIPAASPITTLTWWAAPIQSDFPSGIGGGPAQTFLAAQDSTGAAVTQTVSAAKAYPIPVALFGAASVKCVVNAAGVVQICLKS